MLKRPERNFSDLNAQPFKLEGGDHAVLLLHGFTGSPGHMRPLGERLNAAGYTVQAVTLPGHGTRLEDMRRCTARMYIEAVRQAVVTLKKDYANVTAAGLSMGGVLSLIAAEQMDIHSVIPLSAPMRTRNRLMPLSKIASPFVPVTYWKANPKREDRLDAAYDYGYAGFPTRAAYELYQLITLARKNLFAIHCPLLAIQSHMDDTISKDSLDTIVAGAGSEKKASLWLDHAPHVITLSSELDRIVTAILAFLDEISV